MQPVPFRNFPLFHLVFLNFYLPLLYFIITYFIWYFILAFPLIVFIKSVNYKNH